MAYNGRREGKCPYKHYRRKSYGTRSHHQRNPTTSSIVPTSSSSSILPTVYCLGISKDQMSLICTYNPSLRIPYHPDTANKFLHPTFSSEHVPTRHLFCPPSQVSLQAYTLGLRMIIQELLISFFYYFND